MGDDEGAGGVVWGVGSGAVVQLGAGLMSWAGLRNDGVSNRVVVVVVVVFGCFFILMMGRGFLGVMWVEEVSRW